MSTSVKSAKKRKLHLSPTSSSTAKPISQLNRRLRELRSGQRNLWDDDDDESDLEPCVPAKKPAINNKTYIVLSDSDNEKTSSKISITKKKSTRINNENLISSDNDCKSISKCVTCLICSILTTLTPLNCCSNHLSLLINNKNSHDNHWPPQQVMIVPITDDLIKRYINPEDFYHLKTSSKNQNTTTSTKPNKKRSKKSRTTSESSDIESVPNNKVKSSTKSSHAETEQVHSSPTIFESILPNSGKISQDASYTVITSTSTSTSTSTTISSFESPSLLDTCQCQQSSDQPIIIPDSQPDTQQHDPWTPISDDTYNALEKVLHHNDPSSQEPNEFTPVTARRTPTDVMASRLPKIKLKKGRFRQGKPIHDKTTSDTTTSDCQSSTICQSSSTSTSIIITNNRPVPSLETIIEDESLVIQSTHKTSEKSSQRTENTTEGLSDTVMSCLFAQDESSEHENISITTKTISNEAISHPTIIIEDYSQKHNLNKSTEISQSSQLTNDQTDLQDSFVLTNNEKLPKSARRSYRMNPDGSRINISRSSLSSSSSTILRHTSKGLTPNTCHTRKK